MPRHTYAADVRSPFPPFHREAAHLDRLARAGRLTPPQPFAGRPDAGRSHRGRPASVGADVERTPSGLLVARMRPVGALEWGA